MIENTFQVIPLVSTKRERTIWDSGIRTWNDFLDTECVKGISKAMKERSDSALNEAYGYLGNRDCRSLGEMFPRREHWRLYETFSDDVAFFDIETDGLERDSTVTMVTVHKKNKTTTLIEGIDLDAESLSDAFDDPSMIVSFNGSCFDVPVLSYSFPALDLSMPHFDLRFGCKKVGLSGGLKNIECQIGLARAEDMKDIDGFEAVRLWKQWTRAGDRRSLDILKEYNVTDTVNLKTLADITYKRLVREHAGFCP